MYNSYYMRVYQGFSDALYWKLYTFAIENSDNSVYQYMDIYSQVGLDNIWSQAINDIWFSPNF